MCADAQSALSVIDLANPPPPPPPPPQQRQQPKPKEKPGASAPKNVRSQATPVVAPKPRIETPPVQKIVASDTPRQGTAPTQGASDVRGPGTGAGGPATAPAAAAAERLGRRRRQWRRRSAASRDSGAERARHPARHCSTAGHAARRCSCACGSMRAAMSPSAPSTAEPATRRSIARLCNIAHERLRFRPALNRSGQAVAGWAGYAQPAPR